MIDIHAIKQSEKAFHEDRYSGEAPLTFVDVEGVHRRFLSPSWRGGSDRYSDNKAAFHAIVRAHGGWKGKCVLDYACGFGTWAIYYALTGAREVAGFDIAETAVRRGRARVVAQGLDGFVKLDPMDATRLGYQGRMFDVVIGYGVIHHVIKYPRIFEELHRVMRRGSRAFFLENLADFPLWRWHWKMNRADHAAGDVPIFASAIREKANMFSDIRIIGDTFLGSVKFALFRKNQSKPGPIGRTIIHFTHATDQWLFRLVPSLRRWGSFCYIVLTK